MSRVHAKVMVEKYAVQSTTCDGCGKFEQGEPDGWVHITFSHNDWEGAGESTADESDACSAACLVKVLAAIAEHYGEQEHPTLRWVHITFSHNDWSCVDGRLGLFSRP